MAPQDLTRVADCHHMQSLHAWTRRLARVLVPAAMYVVLASFTPAPAAPEQTGAPAPAPATVAAAPGASPLSRLKAGNERFVRGVRGDMTGHAAGPDAGAETPFAMVLSCADSRFAPELIFGAGLGELYTVRSLGAVVDRSVLASLEYAVDTWQVPMLVVMGHESCAAVKAAHADTPTSSANLEFLFTAIRGGQPRPRAEQQELRGAILANVEEVINGALAGSETLREAVRAGHLQVVGGYYEAASGTVVFSDPVSAATAAHK